MTSALPLRTSEQIQGNILAGFNKDHVAVLLIRFKEVDKARDWLRAVIPQVATTAQVTAFNKKFSEARRNRGGDDPQKLKATWIGLSFTYPGLQFFTEQDEIFTNVEKDSAIYAYMKGADGRAKFNGDVDQNDPEGWLFGRQDEGKEVHAVLTIASDADLEAAVAKQRNEVTKAGGALLFQQDAATLPKHRAGKEHFGFKDGISQPGIRGFDEPDPDNDRYVKGKPGTRIIPAGEIVVGYEKAVPPAPFGRIYPEIKNPPAWMHDGSFYVVRRLAQDVAGWWAQTGRMLQQLKDAEKVGPEATTEWLAARFVGRWQSGASVAKYPSGPPGDPEVVPDNEISYKNDPEGVTTPLFSHLRKCNARDGFSTGPGKPLVSEDLLDTVRLMRRGTPYGAPFDPAGGPGGGADASRGLLFTSYQADLSNQFEFMQKDWVTNPEFPETRDPKPGSDAMISGELTGVSDGEAAFYNEHSPGPEILHFQQFVRTEGAVYGFTPSLATLRDLAEGTLQREGRPGKMIDEIVPVPGHEGEYWTFQKNRVRRVNTNGQQTTDLTQGEGEAFSAWPGLAGIEQLDAILPIPDHQGGDDADNDFWVFHTKDGTQLYRYLTVPGTDGHNSRVGRGGDQSLSAWPSLAGVTRVDAFWPVPDRQPGDDGAYRYWVLHTTEEGQKYRIIAINAGTHGDTKISDGDSSLASWTTLTDLARVEGVTPIGGRQNIEGKSWFGVFHDNQYRIVSVEHDVAHRDALVQGDKPTTEWTVPPTS